MKLFYILLACLVVGIAFGVVLLLITPTTPLETVELETSERFSKAELESAALSVCFEDFGMRFRYSDQENERAKLDKLKAWVATLEDPRWRAAFQVWIDHDQKHLDEWARGEAARQALKAAVPRPSYQVFRKPVK